MQLLQWLCKRSHEQERKSTTKNQQFIYKNEEEKDIILVNPQELSERTKKKNERKVGCKNMKIFSFICKKDIPKACFYSNLNLKRLASFNRRLNIVYPMKMKREELSIAIGITNNKSDSNDLVKNKVSHLTDTSLPNSETKSDKKKVSKMKELVRWYEKGGMFNRRRVVQYRRRGTVKAIDEDDKDFSGRITCSSVTNDHMHRRKGNWITSDSEFVVLEL